MHGREGVEPLRAPDGPRRRARPLRQRVVDLGPALAFLGPGENDKLGPQYTKTLETSPFILVIRTCVHSKGPIW